MTKPQADVDLLVHTQQAVAELQRYVHAFGDMMHKMEHGTKRQKKSSQDVGVEMSKWGKSVSNTVLGLVGMQSMMSATLTITKAITDELRTQEQLRYDSKDTVLNYNDELENLRKQLPQGSPVTADEISQKVIDSSNPYKAQLLQQIVGAISAGLDPDAGKLADTAIMIAERRPELARKDPAALKSLIEAVVEQQRVWGGTAEEQMAMMQLGSSAARTTDIGTFAKYVATVASQAKQMGFSQREGLALAAAIGTNINDPDGFTTSTNALTVLFQATEMAAKHGVDERGMDLINRIRDSKDKEGLQIRKELLGVFMQTMDDKDREQLVKYGKGQLRGRMRAKPALMAWLQGDELPDQDGSTKVLFENALKVLPKTYAEAMDRVLSDEAAARKNPMYQATIANLELENLKVRQELDPRKALQGTMLENIEGIITRSGGLAMEGKLRKGLANLKMYMGQDEVGALDDFMNVIDSAQSTVIQRGLTTEAKSELMSDAYGQWEGVGGFATRVAKTDRFDRITAGNQWIFENLKARQQQELQFLQQLENTLMKMKEAFEAGLNDQTPKPVKDMTPKLSEPAKPEAVGVAEQ